MILYAVKLRKNRSFDETKIVVYLTYSIDIRARYASIVDQA